MHIAVLGAGILGTCTALGLADRGHRVTLIDRRHQPLQEASLHNEGKIHLGFTWAADPTFRTADRMLRGAARFTEVLSRWIPLRELERMRARPFDYVVLRDSMVPPAAVHAHFVRVAQAIEAEQRRAPFGALADDRPVLRQLTPEECGARYDTRTVLAAYETGEVSFDPHALARALARLLEAHSRVEFLGGLHVHHADTSGHGAARVRVRDLAETEQDLGSFDLVINALWANRTIVDRRSGRTPADPWIVRRKLGVNITLAAPPDLQSLTAILGPYGDVVVYPSGRVYLSWYPECMFGYSVGHEDLDWVATLAAVDTAPIAARTIEALSRILPGVASLADAGRVSVEGGFICAVGQTDIDDRESLLHERLERQDSADSRYLSVDTSKYTLAPALADAVAERVGRDVLVG